MRTILFLLLAATPLGFAADAKPDLTPAEAQQVIQKFAAKESEFALARENYTYHQTVKIQEVDGGGKYELVSDIIFSANGKRTEKIISLTNSYFPPPSTSWILTV